MSQHDAPASSTQAIQRFSLFINQLREIMELSMEQPVTDAHLDDMLASSDTLLTLLRQHRQKRALPTYVVNFSDGKATDAECNGILPYSPVSGEFNPLAPPLKFRQDGDKLYGEVTLSRAYEGPPNAVHGAVVATMYDQLLAIANAISGTAGPTAYLKVNYTKPTPMHVPLSFVAWKAEQNGRKVLMRGQCVVDGEVITDCEGLFIQYMPQGLPQEIPKK